MCKRVGFLTSLNIEADNFIKNQESDVDRRD